MKNLLVFIIIYSSFSFPTLAQQPSGKGLERLNFFPDANAFLTTKYQYSILNIETPQGSIKTKEVNNYSNLLSLGYARRLNHNMFFGIRSSYEQASENAVSYGIPLGRFTSYGLKEIEIFTLYRLRFQKEEKGLVDLYISYTPSLGDRKIGGSSSNRYYGQDIFRVNLSHGLWENEWEFRTALNFEYYDQGVEQNAYQQESFIQESYRTLKLQFATQYQFDASFFIYGGVGFNYTSVRTIHENNSAERELQLGTGSIFEVGLKKSLSNWSLLDLNFALNRYDYFVKGETHNLDGDVTEQKFSLTYVIAF